VNEEGGRAEQALQGMFENAAKALQYHREAGAGWRDDEKTVDAILRRIGNLGEAAKRMPVARRGLGGPTTNGSRGARSSACATV